jgi:hypothetical protein
MSTLFFDSLVIREEIDFELNLYHLNLEDKAELLEIIDQMLIHHILNLIFNHLPTEKHHEFISLFQASPHDDRLLISYLKIHAHPEIESEIKKHASKIKSEIIAEIKKSRNQKTRKKRYNKNTK